MHLKLWQGKKRNLWKLVKYVVIKPGPSTHNGTHEDYMPMLQVKELQQAQHAALRRAVAAEAAASKSAASVSDLEGQLAVATTAAASVGLQGGAGGKEGGGSLGPNAAELQVSIFSVLRVVALAFPRISLRRVAKPGPLYASSLLEMCF